MGDWGKAYMEADGGADCRAGWGCRCELCRLRSPLVSFVVDGLGASSVEVEVDAQKIETDLSVEIDREVYEASERAIKAAKAAARLLAAAFEAAAVRVALPRLGGKRYDYASVAYAGCEPLHGVEGRCGHDRFVRLLAPEADWSITVAHTRDGVAYATSVVTDTDTQTDYAQEAPVAPAVATLTSNPFARHFAK